MMMQAQHDAEPQKTLADLWPKLGTDERLSIAIEHSVSDLREHHANRSEIPANRQTWLSGYATALADIHFYVVEGHPLPPEWFR